MCKSKNLVVSSSLLFSSLLLHTMKILSLGWRIFKARRDIGIKHIDERFVPLDSEIRDLYFINKKVLSTIKIDSDDEKSQKPQKKKKNI